MSEHDAAIAEIVALRQRLARIEAAAGHDPAERIWKASEIGDRHIYLAHRDEIMAAQREGRVEDDSADEPEPPARVVYPETGIDRLRQVGEGLYVSTPPEKEPKS
jgi:hypothetical protein